MCYSNSSTSSNEQLAKIYKRSIPTLFPQSPLFYSSGFTLPKWRVITSSPSLQTMSWGLLPHWYQGNEPQSYRQKTLNARIETLHEKKSYYRLIDTKRCVVPSDGFFEWQLMGKTKIPYFIYPNDTPIFSMAGIYDEWVSDSGAEPLQSFSIITTEANTLMAEIHNQKRRMPLLLENSDIDRYLMGSDAIQEFPVLSERFMKAHTVKKSILVSSNCNIPEAQQPVVNNNGFQSSLFS